MTQKPSAVDLDIVILTWNDGPLLDQAVKSSLEATKAVSSMITVIDNASDPPAEVVDHDRVRLIRNPVNRGVAGGRNDGVAATGAPLVCFLDSDAKFHPDSITELLRPFASDPAIAMSVPVFTDQAPEASAGRAPTLRTKIGRIRDEAALYEAMPGTGMSPWWDVEFGIGACQVFRRTAYVEVGGLDESIYWTEDVDFCLRVGKRGHRIVQVGTARVDHPPRRGARKPLSKRGLKHTFAVLRYVVRHRRW